MTAVKRVFRSPTQENGKKSSRREEDHEHEEDQKKRGKRRWILRNPSNHHERVVQHCKEATKPGKVSLQCRKPHERIYDCAPYNDLDSRSESIIEKPLPVYVPRNETSEEISLQGD